MNNKLNNFIDTLIGEIGNVVETQYGFRYHAPRVWLRKHGWRTDWFEVYKRPCDFGINIQVIVPPEDINQFDYYSVGFANLFCISGGKAFIEYPGLSLFYKKFKSNVMKYITKGMPWFDGFSSVDYCIKYLKEHEYNINAPGPKYCLSYLENISNASFDIKSGKYESELQRELFEIGYEFNQSIIETEDDVIL